MSKFDFKTIKPGMRNIKTSLSVLICIVIWGFFSDDPPFFACIAAVITMQNSLGSSIKVGVDRVIGTLIGALIGGLTAYVLPGQKALASLGIIIVIHITHMINKSGATAIACIVFLAILLNIENESIESYILFRVIETFLGIIVAVIINMLIFPPNKRKDKSVSLATD